VLDEWKVFSEFATKRLARKIVKAISKDVAPHISTHMSKERKKYALYRFPLNSTMFFTHETKFLNYYEMNKECICIF